MEYTQIDQDEVARQVYAEQAAQAAWNGYLHSLEAAGLDWCAKVAEATECDPTDAGLQAAMARREQAKCDAEVTGLLEKAEAKRVDLTERRAEFLPRYVADVETAHARHAILAAEASTDEEREGHEVAMLRCEAAQQVALAELNPPKPKGRRR